MKLRKPASAPQVKKIRMPQRCKTTAIDDVSTRDPQIMTTSKQPKQDRSNATYAFNWYISAYYTNVRVAVTSPAFIMRGDDL
jgi:hypothetical protein